MGSGEGTREIGMEMDLVNRANGLQGVMIQLRVYTGIGGSEQRSDSTYPPLLGFYQTRVVNADGDPNIVVPLSLRRPEDTYRLSEEPFAHVTLLAEREPI